MIETDWSSLKNTFEGFGGEAVTLHVRKTGLPFFDALRLYGAIDLYIGLREDVTVQDAGYKWKVHGKRRANRIAKKDEKLLNHAISKKKFQYEAYCNKLRESILDDSLFEEEFYSPTTKAFSGLDSALQMGVRGIAAKKYTTLQSSQTTDPVCIARIPMSDGLLAFAGKKRIESLGSIVFLPIFEGQIDLSKVVSPLRAWTSAPNVLCAQTLGLLALKTSLFAEGYQDRLTGVVFKTNLSGKRSDNYSGLITIESTAIGKIDSQATINMIYRAFRKLVGKAWEKRGKEYRATHLTGHAMAMAVWLMQPHPKHLSGMVTAQEQLYKQGFQHILNRDTFVKEVFQMTYERWEGDYETVRKFAKAVASGIYFTRMVEEEGKEKDFEARRKAWYDEVTMLRSAPSAKTFIERAMILIEQGHRKHSQVGTAHRNEDFDPQSLLDSINSTARGGFEAFRDLFRMYLVQESTHEVTPRPEADTETVPIEPAAQDEETIDDDEGE